MARKKPIYLRLDKEGEKRFFQIKKFLGLKNDTEVMRSLINSFWREHEKELLPKLEYFNIDENGVKILDRELNIIAQIYFRPEGAFCEYCKTSNCKHIQEALTWPLVQENLRKKGWNYREG